MLPSPLDDPLSCLPNTTLSNHLEEELKEERAEIMKIHSHKFISAPQEQQQSQVQGPHERTRRCHQGRTPSRHHYQARCDGTEHTRAPWPRLTTLPLHLEFYT